MNEATRTYDKHWIPNTVQTLIDKGIPTVAPLMPNPWAPNYEAFKTVLDALDVNESTVLIGHSCGCAFLVRWLGDTKRTIAKLILVAPWKIPDEGDEEREKFYLYPIDQTIATRVNEIVMFTSNDEEEDGKKSLEIFHQSLSGKIINLPNHGHYTFDDMGTNQFPELVDVILN